MNQFALGIICSWIEKLHPMKKVLVNTVNTNIITTVVNKRNYNENFPSGKALAQK